MTIEGINKFLWELPEVVFVLLYLSQFALPIYVLIRIFKRSNILSAGRFWLLYSFLAGVVYYYSAILAYKYIVVRVNDAIYGFEAGLMGVKGLAEDFVLNMFVFFPMVGLLTLIFRFRFPGFRHYAAFHLALYALSFFIYEVTSDLWFPGLVNYGSAY